jgi:hypothetical protein
MNKGQNGETKSAVVELRRVVADDTLGGQAIQAGLYGSARKSQGPGVITHSCTRAGEELAQNGAVDLVKSHVFTSI